MSQSKKYDIVLFGATGFTGTLTAEYFAKHCLKSDSNLRLALAGRNESKLQKVKEKMCKLNPAFENVEFLIVDVNNRQDLANMTQAAKVLITSVGPYIENGIPVVEACVENFCHYVDLTGEPLFVNTLRKDLHQKAKANKVKIVNGGGFDSIPYDLVVLFAINKLKQLFPEDEFQNLNIDADGVFGVSTTFSGGSWHTLVTILSSVGKDNKVRKKLDPSAEGTTDGTRVKSKPERISYRKDLKTWLVPAPTIDAQVVKRSANLRGDYGKTFKYGHFLQIKHWPTMAAIGIGGSILMAMSQFNFTRELLFKFKTPGEGPTQEQMDKGWFKIIAEVKAGGESVTAHVSGGDPGYEETSVMLAHAALCLAFDDDKTPENYGIVTPAAAMGEPLIERLDNNGIKFVVDSCSKESIAEAA